MILVLNPFRKTSNRSKLSRIVGSLQLYEKYETDSTESNYRREAVSHVRDHNSSLELEDGIKIDRRKRK